MAPVERGSEGLLAGHHGASAAGEEPEAVVELGGDALGGQMPATSRGQLDGERDAVEAVADLGEAGALASLTANEGRARRARSTNSFTASYCDSAGTSSVSSRAGQRIDGTRQVTSPGTPRGSRLVVNTDVDGLADEQPATSSAQAATRCSQLSNTTSDGSSPSAAAS